ncbi:MAG: DUF2357 domain-containing protein, partial [Oscillospiraceae bacterium]|nr:DUF2357 domain-containing protein [Oscillospiraceae bacterium]
MQQWRDQHHEYMELYDDDVMYQSLMTLLRGSTTTFAMNRRLMQKIIDTSWVEAIENGLIHVDNVLRHPGRTIEDVEEIVPIALSKKITVESVKHLAQHTDLIQSIDRKTGKITPSKILNVHKEESLLTYENKFINTLIDRLYIFISMRYEKLAKVTNDEEVFTLGFDTSLDDRAGGRLKIEVKLESERSLEKRDRSGFTVWQRVQKLKKAIEGYKGSDFCKTLGSNYIRPPVMRTNAIMKNVDLKACLTLWQYIESYDKVGYEINIEDSAVKPTESLMEDFCELAALQMLLLRSAASPDQEILETRQIAPISPVIRQQFSEEIGETYSAAANGTAGYISGAGTQPKHSSIPENIYQIYRQIEAVIEIERAYQEALHAEKLAEQRAAEEAERRRLEEERIEEERQAELARIQAEKEEQERRVQEMLEQKKREQEEALRERERQEQERLALLEQKRLEKEAEEKRLAEERAQREAEEAAAREAQRIRDEKIFVRAELGEAAGSAVPIPEKEPELPAAVPDEPEDPAVVAARNKKLQQQRELERIETERAQRLKAERQHFESKSFEEIRREYSRSPFRALLRLIRHLLVTVFHIIPKDTDRPDYITLRKELAFRREEQQKAKQEHRAMEVYYRKYAQSPKYRLMRAVDDIKFRRKKEKARRSQPRPTYTPPNRTPEEALAHQREMRAMYKKYHVSLAEKLRRKLNDWQIRFREWKQDSDATAFLRQVSGWCIAVILVVSIAFSAYVTACMMRGKPAVFFGRSVLRIETGSMEPTLHVGDCIIVRTD